MQPKLFFLKESSLNKLRQTGFEVILILTSVLITNALHLKVNLIPEFVFRYQQGYYTTKEISNVALIYIISGFLFLYSSKLNKYRIIFSNEKHLAREIFIVALSSSTSSLVIFIFTRVFFDPNFVAMQFLVVLFLYIFVFIVERGRTNTSNPIPSIRIGLVRLLSETLKFGMSKSGICIILIALLPLTAALKFKKDKKFANTINRMRDVLSGFGLAWKLTPIYPGIPLTQPIFLRYNPTDPKKLYVLERSGRLFILNNSGMKEEILDFRSRVGAVQIENGALGFAFHPTFASKNSYIYIYYTDVHNKKQINRLSRFDLSLQTKSERLASELVLIEQNRNPSGFHNGGSVEFGPDGFLYIGIGDANDGRNNNQTISNSLFSGIFRIDVDMKGGEISHEIPRQPRAGRTQNYMIPNDNPFVGQSNVLEEFWVLGLRNPFRFSFDRKTGLIWVGEVGEDLFEEINVLRKGGNYQWAYFEGFQRTKIEKPKTIIGKESPPLFTYRHTAKERAIIGGIVYRGEKHPRLRGKYLFVDNGSGTLYSLEQGNGRKMIKLPLAKTDQYAHVGIASVAETPTGEVLVTTLGSKSRPSGRILRLEK